MTPERAAQFARDYTTATGKELHHIGLAILAATREERHAALTEAAELVERVPNHSLHDAMRDLRDKGGSMSQPVRDTYKLDLDALERDIRAWARLPPDELLPLIAITRAAVAWRDNAPQSGTLNALLDALRDAGL